MFWEQNKHHFWEVSTKNETVNPRDSRNIITDMEIFVYNLKGKIEYATLKSRGSGAGVCFTVEKIP